VAEELVEGDVSEGAKKKKGERRRKRA